LARDPEGHAAPNLASTRFDQAKTADAKLELTVCFRIATSFGNVRFEPAYTKHIHRYRSAGRCFFVLEIVASRTSICHGQLALPGIIGEILSFYLDVHETCELDIVSAKFRRSSSLESFQNNPDLLVGTEYVP
jgi:hypothetical protein